jgi:hypothetical protein
MPTGPDACLGYLPFTSHACCGHGDITLSYLVLTTAGPDADMTRVKHFATFYGRPARWLQWLMRPLGALLTRT